MTTALFIGRFQPFHKGHLSAIKEIFKEADKLIIGVGSSQYSNTKENPFSFEERFKMIENTLVKEGISDYTIFPIPDIKEDNKWVEHVRVLLPKFNIVYSSNPLVIRLFKDSKYYKKDEFKLKKVKIVKGVTSTIIRSAMKKGSAWKRFVPEESKKIIESVKGCERVKRLK